MLHGQQGKLLVEGMGHGYIADVDVGPLHQRLIAQRLGDVQLRGGLLGALRGAGGDGADLGPGLPCAADPAADDAARAEYAPG